MVCHHNRRKEREHACLNFSLKLKWSRRVRRSSSFYCVSSFASFFASSSYQCWRWKSCAREVLKYNWRAGGSQQLFPRWASLQKKVYFSFSFVADKIVLWALMITTSTTHYKQQFNRCPGDENVDCSFFCKKWSLCFCANSQTKMAKNDCFTVGRLPSYFLLPTVNSFHFVDKYCTHTNTHTCHECFSVDMHT